MSSGFADNIGSWAQKIGERVGDFHQGKSTLKIAEDRVATEFISVGVFMLASYVLDNHLELAPVKNVIAKGVKPFISKFDHAMDNWGTALESDSETAERQGMNVDDRAYHYADMMFDTTAGLALSFVVQSRLQECLDTKRGVHFQQDKVTDKGHVGNFVHNNLVNSYNRAMFFDKVTSAVVAMAINTTFAQKNEEVQDKLQAVMEKMGVEHESANDMAKSAISVGTPNLLGMITATSLLSIGYNNRPH